MIKKFINKNKHLIKCSREVLKAIDNKIPLVALESSIISHGMPYPESLEMAKDIEGIIRDEGVQPATLAILDGKIQIGLDPEILDAFAKFRNVEKVSSINLDSTIFSKKPGGTTVSGSLRICKLASISVFVTGGIGGVHRNVSENMDVSSDLQAIKESEIITVCAGPKTILDISKTYELLETLSIPAFSYRQNNLPAFWYRDTKLLSTHRVESPEAMAKIYSIARSANCCNGLLLCNPIPKKYSLDQRYLEPLILNGVMELKKSNITGKELTPSLLKYLVEKTKGKTLLSNIELVKNNARLGAKVAKALDY